MEEELFRAHEAIGTTVPTYFIESTAPDNVDDYDAIDPSIAKDGRDVLKPIRSNDAIGEIAKVLANATRANLVIMVHGFNNPRPAVFETYVTAAQAIARDPKICSRPGLVCVGYRWPSEHMGSPRKGTWDALPTLPTWVLYLGALVVLLSFPLLYLVPERGLAWNTGAHLVTMIGLTFGGLVLAAALLRTIVYFRDNYRASNYGVPDLIQIIRTIDGRIKEIDGDRKRQGNDRVQLSFIGHSMGAFVVTNAIRTLSDLFAVASTDVNDSGARKGLEAIAATRSPDVGHAFRLMRFVLASPDIPAEALLSTRGNVLASALRRFDEAYLFSNEGDAVLRQISTLANYFVFPTKSRNYGFRLGNVEILKQEFGLNRAEPDQFLAALRIGKLNLQELYDVLEKARAARLSKAGVQATPDTDIALPKVFTYFDCTDYRDVDRAGEERPLLTFGLCRKNEDPQARLRWYSHLHLLIAYLWSGAKRPNVHGGYFEGQLAQQLIFRLACLGYEGTVEAFDGEDALSKLCIQKQIRALVSPLLIQQGRAAPEAPRA